MAINKKSYDNLFTTEHQHVDQEFFSTISLVKFFEMLSS